MAARLRRSKHLRRQSRVQPDDADLRKQISEPVPSCAGIPPIPPLIKHDSYPQYLHKNHRRMRAPETEVNPLMVRSMAVDRAIVTVTGPIIRARHTPAVRAGPPLSCNFCWNTVDDSGRILRRKTQYHCPECNMNLCIVPCFHEYHDADANIPSTDGNASAR